MKHALPYIKDKLLPIYPATEIASFTKIITEHLLGRQYSPLLLNVALSAKQTEEFNQIVERLLEEEPIQYILGETEFYSLPFYVNKDVLIPRPETEELVELILNNSNKEAQLNILDIGTGSGCIAISLAANLPRAQVDAWDISPKALTVARSNAERNKVTVNFYEQDVFNEIPLSKKYDIIVSNPPYILEKEKEEMEKNVLKYEPHIALFVPTDKGLIFYHRIAEVAQNLLVSSGDLYYEINRAKGDETRKMLEEMAYENIEIYKDIFQNNRMTKATYKG